MKRQPAMFLGHGSPMTMIAQNAARTTFEALGRHLERPKAIVCITAHWETRGATGLTSAATPPTIHDFRGFPQALHDMRYPAPGDPELAGRIAKMIGNAQLDDAYGFDHGVWGTLLPVFPEANIPVVAMSVDMSATTERHLAIGRALATLREEGIMLIASGNIVHNLTLWPKTRGTQPDWAVAFQSRINRALRTRNDAALTTFAADDVASATAINSGEHYLPLLYAVGARLPDDDVSIFNDHIDGALSMTSVAFGASATFATLV